jgi:RNase P subunit RPR2
MIVSTIDHRTCRACGRRITDAQQVLSRHSTAEGVVAWVRCSCGALQARFRPYGQSSERVVASSDTHLTDQNHQHPPNVGP